MKKTKQILAIVTVVIIVMMYILSLVFALLRVENWQRMFFASMGMTILLPVIAWFCLWSYNTMMSRRTLQDGEVELGHGRHKP